MKSLKEFLLFNSHKKLRASEEIEVMRREFDRDFYLLANPDVRASKQDPFEHFIRYGWKEGRDPHPDFSVTCYMGLYPDARDSGQNPFYHYLCYSRDEDRSSGFDTRAANSQVLRQEFDTNFYLASYSDVRRSGVDPLMHYLTYGWYEGRDPTPSFSTKAYMLLNPDILGSRINPFMHYIFIGRDQGRPGALPKEAASDFLKSRAYHVVQDQSFPLATERAEKLMVIVIPEHNEMSGGIYSFFSIARAAYNMRRLHGYRVLLMTRPNRHDLTYLRQRNFRNSEDVFRFEQITRCRNASEVYLHIPEYMASTFVASLNCETKDYLSSRSRLYVNILNQKSDIMPEKDEFEDLRALAHEISISVAHHAYFGQPFADRYSLPMLLLPAYTDLSLYEPSDFHDKESLIIYSPDDSPYRESVLNVLSEQLKEYELREIKGITFDDYMDLATRCRFSITFGEGFDGYLAQPIYQGGVGLAVFNDEFFPSRNLLNLFNIFPDNHTISREIVSRIRKLESDEHLYRRTNREMMDVYNKLYSKNDYLNRIGKLTKREFDIFPLDMDGLSRTIKL